MLRIGLTGGVASGKSAVADLFATLGIAVIDTDVIARQVVAPGTEGLGRLTERFGTGILKDDGTLNRGAMRERAFADTAVRNQLEAILHPLIRAATLGEMQRTTNQTAYQVIVVPLLVETGFKSLVDRVLVVDCPEALQRERLMARDGSDAATSDAMIAAQASRAERLALADDVIVNDGSLEALGQKVAALHEQYLTLAAG